jgi:hypothetical protein
VTFTPGHVLIRTVVGAGAFAALAWFVAWGGRVLQTAPIAEEARA